jgi:hypothetical protein
LYDINDITFIKGLVRDYSKNGKYQEFGDKGNGTKRNAIARYKTETLHLAPDHLIQVVGHVPAKTSFCRQTSV